jgi:DNA repair protein RAD5
MARTPSSASNAYLSKPLDPNTTKQLQTRFMSHVTCIIAYRSWNHQRLSLEILADKRTLTMTHDKPPDRGLFFAASDDEDDDKNSTAAQSARPAPPPSSLHYSSPQKRLFFADSDDDDIPRFQTPNPIVIDASLVGHGDDSGSDLELPSFEEVPRASSVSSMSSGPSLRTSSPVPGPSGEEPPVKKRRLSPPKVQAHTGQLEGPCRTTYLGSFIVGNAWSTVRGKGYIKPGDVIRIERDDPDVSGSGLSVPAKGKKKVLLDKGKTKQLTLGAMLKSQPPKSTKKIDTVVRLTNDRGFGEPHLNRMQGCSDISLRVRSSSTAGFILGFETP